MALPSFIIPGSNLSAAVEPNPQFNIDRECPNANCVDRLVGLVEAKIDRAKRDSCLPPDGTANEQEWYETRTHSAECFKLVKEIEEDIQNNPDNYTVWFKKIIHTYSKEIHQYTQQ
jgi:hypothetical protein